MDLQFLLFLAVFAFFITYALIPKMKKYGEKRGISAHDLNKSGMPKVFHIGGIAIASAFFLSGLLVIGLEFSGITNNSINSSHALVILLTGISISFLGLVDDLFSAPAWMKLLLPMMGALPLIALKAVGDTIVTIPFLGTIDFGLFYIFAILPLAISGCANLANIFAGINGLEAGLSLVMYSTALFFGIHFEKIHMAVFSAIMVGSLIAFLKFNWYPAKVFPGDTGTLLFGAVLATTAIIDNFESFVPILFIPHLIDGVIKIKNNLPSTGWSFAERNGYLYAPQKRVSLLQHTVWALKRIREEDLTLFYIAVQMLCALIAIIIFVL